MTIHYIIYLSIVGIGIILLIIFHFMLRKSAEKLPHIWKNSLSLKCFRIGVFLLMIHLLLLLISEFLTIYLSMQWIYNSFVISIGYTLYTPFLFGFLFIYTQTTWKRYSYILLYAILVGYFVIGGYYLPGSAYPPSTMLVFSNIYFLAALLHLTDLLMNPKSEYFKFQLKVNICILIYNILSSITASFLWAYTDRELPGLSLIFYINLYILITYYVALDLIFIHEIRKLRKS